MQPRQTPLLKLSSSASFMMLRDLTLDRGGAANNMFTRQSPTLQASERICPNTAIGSSEKSPPLDDERSNALADQAIIDGNPVIAVVR